MFGKSRVFLLPNHFFVRRGPNSCCSANEPTLSPLLSSGFKRAAVSSLVHFIFVHFIISRISLQYSIQTTVTITKRINLSTLLNIQGVKVSISSKCIRYNDPCKNGVKCVNLPGNYRCDFKTGYTRNNCETGAQLPLITQLVS